MQKTKEALAAKILVQYHKPKPRPFGTGFGIAVIKRKGYNVEFDTSMRYDISEPRYALIDRELWKRKKMTSTIDTLAADPKTYTPAGSAVKFGLKP